MVVKLVHALRNLIRNTALIGTSDDSGAVRTIEVSDREKKAKAAVLTPYGFDHSPPIGSIGVTFQLQGSESDLAGLFDKPSNRFKLLPGEVAVGNPETGSRTKFAQDGSVDTYSIGEVKVNALGNITESTLGAFSMNTVLGYSVVAGLSASIISAENISITSVGNTSVIALGSLGLISLTTNSVIAALKLDLKSDALLDITSVGDLNITSATKVKIAAPIIDLNGTVIDATGNLNMNFRNILNIGIYGNYGIHQHLGVTTGPGISGPVAP